MWMHLCFSLSLKSFLKNHIKREKKRVHALPRQLSKLVPDPCERVEASGDSAHLLPGSCQAAHAGSSAAEAPRTSHWMPHRLAVSQKTERGSRERASEGKSVLSQVFSFFFFSPGLCNKCCTTLRLIFT